MFKCFTTKYFIVHDIWSKPDLADIEKRCDPSYMAQYDVKKETKWKQLFGTDAKIFYETEENIYELNVLTDFITVHPRIIKKLFNSFDTVQYNNGEIHLHTRDRFAILRDINISYYEKKFTGAHDLIELITH